MRAPAIIPVLILALAACARPLSEGEIAFANTVQGPALQTESVRLHNGALIGNIIRTRPARPAATCRERIRPPETGEVRTATAAFVLGQRIFVARRLWRDDFLNDYPHLLPLEDAMLLAHELTHIWQWQTRQQTGYHPFRAALEHAQDDPYLFDLSRKTFADYGWEQQAALVEEFVCCRALDADGARTARLHDLLTPVFPGLERRSRAMSVALTWPKAEIGGICS